jgi:hypothetical protein
VGSRRCACAGRQESWVRYGKSPGHHRGLRAGHVSTGGTRERGRATCLLDDIPGMGDRVSKSPGGILGAFPEVPSPEGTPRTTEARKVSGSERQAKRPERDRMAVVASHRTGEGGEPRPTGPMGGKATLRRASSGQDTRERLCAHQSCHQTPIGLHQGQQRLCLRNRMRSLRTYGSVGGPDG